MVYNTLHYILLVLHCLQGDAFDFPFQQFDLSVKRWMLVATKFDWSFAGLTAPAVTNTFHSIQNSGILVPAYPGCPGKRPLNDKE